MQSYPGTQWDQSAYYYFDNGTNTMYTTWCPGSCAVCASQNQIPVPMPLSVAPTRLLAFDDYFLQRLDNDLYEAGSSHAPRFQAAVSTDAYLAPALQAIHYYNVLYADGVVKPFTGPVQSPQGHQQLYNAMAANH
jgi:hypothetical protein